jgi:hypothetical protein
VLRYDFERGDGELSKVCRTLASDECAKRYERSSNVAAEAEKSQTHLSISFGIRHESSQACMMLEAFEKVLSSVYLVQMSDEFADICKRAWSKGVASRGASRTALQSGSAEHFCTPLQAVRSTGAYAEQHVTGCL